MKPYYDEGGITIYLGDAREVLAALPDGSVRCCVTSPPYWGLRDYGVDEQIGLESTPDQYVERLVNVFREVRRVLRDDGTLWLNMGDCYAHTGACGGGSPLSDPTDGREGDHSPRGRKDDRTAQQKTGGTMGTGLKSKDLVGMPWTLAFALRSDGWYLRSDIIWHKPNPMPESVTDRPTKAHEYIFLMSKSARYYYDADAVREKSVMSWNSADRMGKNTKLAAASDSERDFMRTHGFGSYHPDVERTDRNLRTVWTVGAQAYAAAHFAVFPPKLINPCIKAGAKAGDTVLDPFMGSGTTAMVARELGCKCVGAEINGKYIDLAAKRLAQGVLEFK